MPTTMLDFLTEQLVSGNALGQMSRQLGTDDAATSQAVAAVLPMLITALARNASQPKGADALHGALVRDHDGSLLKDVGRYVGQGNTAAGDAILGHVLGTRRPAIEKGLSQEAGLDLSVVTQLLPLLAPLVLAYLGRTQRQKQLDPGDLAAFLAKERTHVERSAPTGLEVLAGLLDADQDGSATDDAARIGLGFLDKLLKSRKK